MKQLIILAATIALGIVIFNLIAGPGEDSIKNTLQNAWSYEIYYKTQKGVQP